ncbi:MAG: hypothetical protein Q9182_003001 [Xanthomendoza sp. 2 TL-2023]
MCFAAAAHVVAAIQASLGPKKKGDEGAAAYAAVSQYWMEQSVFLEAELKAKKEKAEAEAKAKAEKEQEEAEAKAKKDKEEAEAKEKEKAEAKAKKEKEMAEAKAEKEEKEVALRRQLDEIFKITMDDYCTW